ncbi:hypothetical protein HJFPF1_11240 [Paramyrothecium foliicola]|nr:hypothetical protein HJFPF1_11240 [Paramyrothecium foliicola]
MDNQQNHNEGAALNPLGKMMAQFVQYGHNASNNLQDTFSNMTPQSWIRLIVIVGGYMLLRPYVLKAISHGAVKNMEEQDAKEKAAAAAMTPNDLRGVKDKIEEQEEEDYEEAGAAAWGQQARVRQRRVLKQLLEAEEKRREEEEEDKDIQEYLED